MFQPTTTSSRTASIIHVIGFTFATVSNHPPDSSGGKNAEGRNTAAKKIGNAPFTASTDPVRRAMAIAMAPMAEPKSTPTRTRDGQAPHAGGEAGTENHEHRGEHQNLGKAEHDHATESSKEHRNSRDRRRQQTVEKPVLHVDRGFSTRRSGRKHDALNDGCRKKERQE